MTTLEALAWRYATKVFDPTQSVSDDDLRTILEAGRLAPSSFGVEPWQFIVVENPEVRAKLRAASYDQPKVTDAAHIIVIARRTDARANITRELIERTARIQNVAPESLDGLRDMVDGSITRRSDAELDAWVTAQTYIALGVMITTASLMHIDNCPMEGFDNAAVDALLGLPAQHLASTTMLALGKRGDDPAAARPKVRRDFSDVVTFIH